MSTTITIPLDIPEIEVLGAEITDEKHLLIRVESRQKTTGCGVCGRQIVCTFGQQFPEEGYEGSIKPGEGKKGSQRPSAKGRM